MALDHQPRAHQNQPQHTARTHHPHTPSAGEPSHQPVNDHTQWSARRCWRRWQLPLGPRREAPSPAQPAHLPPTNLVGADRATLTPNTTQVEQLLAGRRYAVRLVVSYGPGQNGEDGSSQEQQAVQVHNPPPVLFSTAPDLPSTMQPPALAQRARNALKVCAMCHQPGTPCTCMGAASACMALHAVHGTAARQHDDGHRCPAHDRGACAAPACSVLPTPQLKWQQPEDPGCASEQELQYALQLSPAPLGMEDNHKDHQVCCRVHVPARLPACASASRLCACEGRTLAYMLLWWRARQAGWCRLAVLPG